MIQQYLSGCSKLVDKGNYQEAIAGYELILKMAPNSIPAYRNSALCYSYLNDWRNAFNNILNALISGDNNLVEMNVFIDILERSHLSSFAKPIEATLIIAMSLPSLEDRAIPLLKQQIQAKYPQLFTTPTDEFNHCVDALIQEESFCLVIQQQLNHDYQTEALILLSRKEILKQISEGKDTQKYIPFLASLACQLLLNDGLYSHSNQEDLLLVKLKDAKTQKTEATLISLCYSSFEDIISFWRNNKNLIEASKQKSLISDLQFYTNILENRTRKQLKDKTSQIVQSFYLDNPYPTWKTTKIESNTKGLDYIFTSCDKGIPASLTILSAGCGTGVQLINLALTTPDANIVAIDICPTSLAYAELMCAKYNIKNITFHLMDILDVAKLNHDFDYIMCTGVLHHMSSPQDGMNALESVLKPDGIMHLAFYSTAARRELTTIKANILDFLDADEASISREGIRKWRAQLSHDQKQLSWFKVADFFSLSGIYDLLFHPQQAEYTPLELDQLLCNTKLTFKRMKRGLNTQKIAKQFPTPKEGETLEYWQKVEQSNPDLFRCMISFYACKK